MILDGIQLSLHSEIRRGKLRRILFSRFSPVHSNLQPSPDKKFINQKKFMSVYHPSVRNIVSSMVMMMFTMAATRRVSTRLCVQAFTTSYGLPAVRSILTTNQGIRKFSVPRATHVDEDLDAALDDLLGNALKAERPSVPKPIMKESKQVPPKFVETVSTI